jgi:hypothetical protein
MIITKRSTVVKKRVVSGRNQNYGRPIVKTMVHEDSFNPDFKITGEQATDEDT